MIVYISGPITKLAPDVRARNFARAERYLRKHGFSDVINPEASLRGLGLSHRELMIICSALLEPCEVIALLPGWRESTGACMELGMAIRQNCKIYEFVSLADPGIVELDYYGKGDEL